jgi:hypothetical protein
MKPAEGCSKLQRPLRSAGREPITRDGFFKVEPCPATRFLSLEPSLLLKRLARAVNSPKRRLVGEPTPDELIVARVRIDRADLKALGRSSRAIAVCLLSMRPISSRAGGRGASYENNAESRTPSVAREVTGFGGG